MLLAVKDVTVRTLVYCASPGLRVLHHLQSLSITVFHRGALHSVTQPKRIRVMFVLPV